MTTASIFLDESGDLGWILDKPRLQGGSSRFIVLGAVVVPDRMNGDVEKIVRDMYKMRGRPLSSELKSTHLGGPARLHFAKEIAKLKRKKPGFSFHAVVVEKANVINALSTKKEALYNHMAEQMLAERMGEFARVDFYPDQRVVKPRDKNALHNYLETRLAIHGHMVEVTTTPSDSCQFREIQAADYIAGIVWAKYEEGDTLYDQVLAGTVDVKKLY